MENSLIKKTQEEAEEVLNKLEICKKGSEEYYSNLETLRKLMDILDEEQKRINSIQELERKEDELAFNQRKAEADRELEMEKLKEQKKAHWWELGLKILGGIIVAGGNVAMMLTAIKINNSGETLTSFENKFIYPERFR